MIIKMNLKKKTTNYNIYTKYTRYSNINNIQQSIIAEGHINISLLFFGLSGILVVFPVIRVFPVNLVTAQGVTFPAQGTPS